MEVLPEHRSPEAFVEYRALRERRPVVGMTTFPNTVLLRGPRTIVVDPGLPLQNDPVLRALEARGLSAGDVDLVVLTHAHLDHAGGCACAHGARGRPRARDAVRRTGPLAGGLLELLPLERLTGEAGELAPGVEWALTPGHCEGHISLAVETDRGRVVLCGDTIGPGPRRVRRHGGACRAGRAGAAGVVAAHPRLGAGPRSSPATCRRSLPEAAARRSVPRPACATLRPLVTTSGRLLRAYLRISV